jgi:hypothetical protein
VVKGPAHLSWLQRWRILLVASKVLRGRRLLIEDYQLFCRLRANLSNGEAVDRMKSLFRVTTSPATTPRPSNPAHTARIRIPTFPIRSSHSHSPNHQSEGVPRSFTRRPVVQPARMRCVRRRAPRTPRSCKTGGNRRRHNSASSEVTSLSMCSTGSGETSDDRIVNASNINRVLASLVSLGSTLRTSMAFGASINVDTTIEEVDELAAEAPSPVRTKPGCTAGLQYFDQSKPMEFGEGSTEKLDGASSAKIKGVTADGTPIGMLTPRGSNSHLPVGDLADSQDAADAAVTQAQESKKRLEKKRGKRGSYLGAALRSFSIDTGRSLFLPNITSLVHWGRLQVVPSQ